MESHLEARLWNDVFVHAQDALGIPQGTIRATVLIETYPAAFEMEEILYELRDHSAGLNAGRWDYMFCVIKKFRTRGADFLLPDRNSVTMTVPFMRAYTELLVRTCHKRGAHAIGGMAAFIPSKDEEVNEAAFDEGARRQDPRGRRRLRRLVGRAPRPWSPLCTEVFDARARRPAEPGRPDPRRRARHAPTSCSTCGRRPATVTEAGLRSNISVGVQYLEAWLRGTGAVGINNLMEDAATAEISRSQVWQWLHNDVELDDGQTVTRDLVERLIDEEMAGIRDKVGDDAFDDGQVGRRAVAVHRDGARRRLRGLPHPPGVRADAVTDDRRHVTTGGRIDALAARLRAELGDGRRASPTGRSCAPTSATGSPTTR